MNDHVVLAARYPRVAWVKQHWESVRLVRLSVSEWGCPLGPCTLVRYIGRLYRTDVLFDLGFYTACKSGLTQCAIAAPGDVPSDAV